MQQSNVIFGALFLAFIVFITVRGELPTYLSLLRGSGQTKNIGNEGSISVGSSDNPFDIAKVTGNIGTALDTGKDAISNAAKLLDLFGG